jgi:hypothetical protein
MIDIFVGMVGTLRRERRVETRVGGSQDAEEALKALLCQGYYVKCNFIQECRVGDGMRRMTIPTGRTYYNELPTDAFDNSPDLRERIPKLKR